MNSQAPPTLATTLATTLAITPTTTQQQIDQSAKQLAAAIGIETSLKLMQQAAEQFQQLQSTLQIADGDADGDADDDRQLLCLIAHRSKGALSICSNQMLLDALEKINQYCPGGDNGGNGSTSENKLEASQFQPLAEQLHSAFEQTRLGLLQTIQLWQVTQATKADRAQPSSP